MAEVAELYLSASPISAQNSVTGYLTGSRKLITSYKLIYALYLYSTAFEVLNILLHSTRSFATVLFF